MFIADSFFINKKSLTGYVRYQVDKALATKNKYTLYFWHYGYIKDYWRREATDNLEIFGFKGGLQITEENSSIPMDENFEKFLLNHINDYFLECKMESYFIASASSLNGVIQFQDLQEQLSRAGLATSEEQITFLNSKVTKAY